MSTEDERRDAILAHIEQFGIARKDPSQPSPQPRKPAAVSGGSGRKRTLRVTLDLHGQRSEEAARRLRAALYRCRDTGTTELLVIHGYGRHSDPNEGPVLKKMVHDMLDNELQTLYRYYRSAAFKDGGDGATLVLFR